MQTISVSLKGGDVLRANRIGEEENYYLERWKTCIQAAAWAAERRVK